MVEGVTRISPGTDVAARGQLVRDGWSGMADERSNQLTALLSGDSQLVVVGAAYGPGKATQVRRWASHLHSSVVLWPDITPPPRTASSFWMRAISLLHSRGLVTDEFLYRTTAEGNQTHGAVLEGLGNAIAAIHDAPVLIIDDLHAAVDHTLYQHAVEGLLRLTERDPRLKIVLVESAANAIADVDRTRLDRMDIRARDLTTPAGPVGRLSDVRDLDILKTLCITAIPPRVDVRLAALLTGDEGSEELLNSFVRFGFGSWTSDALGQNIFEYSHPIRREALRILRRRWPEDRRTGSRALAGWYVSYDQLELALEHAIDSEDVDLIGHIALRITPSTMTLAESILSRLASIPVERVKENALLSLWMAIQIELSPRSRLDARAYFHAAIQAARVRSRSMNATEALLLLGVEAYALRRTGAANRGASAAVKFHDRANELMAANRIDPGLDQAFANFAYQVGVSLIYSDQYVKATALLANLEQFCHARGIGYRRNSAIAARAYLEAVAGRTCSSEALTRRVVEDDWPHTWRGGNIKTYFGLSDIVRTALRVDRAALEQAVAGFRDTAEATEHWDVFLFGEVTLDLAAGNARSARVRFDSAARANVRKTTHPGILRRLNVIRQLLHLAGERPVTFARAATGASEQPIALALGAALDLDRRQVAAAAEKLGKATAHASTPLEQHLTFAVLARLGVESQDLDSVRSSASHLHVLLEKHGLRIGFTLLSAEERNVILAAQNESGLLRDAFSAIRPLNKNNAQVIDTTLTPMQLTVLTQLAKSSDRQKVAEELYLSPGTVKAHLRAVYKKLNAHSQAEAVSKAAAAGLIVEHPLRGGSTG